MRKVLVIGPGGAGKTTFAGTLAQHTGLPLIHLDALYWSAEWRPAPNDEWDRTIEQLVARDAWVMDGNYGRTLSVRLAACDTVIFLDMPAHICLWRVLRRLAALPAGKRAVVLRGPRAVREYLQRVVGVPGDPRVSS